MIKYYDEKQSVEEDFFFYFTPLRLQVLGYVEDTAQ